MDVDRGKITAVITTYNRPPEIVDRALKSIESQTFPVTEIIVVDDNPFSSSDLSNSIRSVCADRAVYIKQPKGNAGAAAARNLGIKNAHGSYIAFLDDDDEWLPQKIEKEMALFEDGVGLVFCGGICHVLSGDSWGSVLEEYDYFNLRNFNREPSHNNLLLDDCIGSTSQPVMRMDVFQKAGMFDEEMPAGEDYDLWLRISKHYRIAGVPEKLFIHNLHENGQLSKNRDRAYRAYKRLFEKYKDEYNQNRLAWLDIHVMIEKNHDGILGSSMLFYYRMLRKIYRIIGH